MEKAARFLALLMFCLPLAAQEPVKYLGQGCWIHSDELIHCPNDWVMTQSPLHLALFQDVSTYCDPGNPSCWMEPAKASIDPQDIPRSEVQELLDIHDRQLEAKQGQIDSLTGELRSKDQQLVAWKDIAAAYERMKQADALTIQAQQEALDKVQQSAGAKRSLWGTVKYWTLPVAAVGILAAALVMVGD